MSRTDRTPRHTVLRPSRSSLEDGILPLSPELRLLLPRHPEVVPVLLLGPDGQRLEAELDNRHNLIYHPRLKRFFRKIGSGAFLVGVRAVVPAPPFVVISVEPASPAPAARKEMPQSPAPSRPLQQGKNPEGERRGRSAGAPDQAVPKERIPPPAAFAPLAPVPIRFEDGAWEGLAAALEQGRYSTDREEFLHRRSLMLAAHPGFETLLSLQVLTTFTPFDYQVQVARQVLSRMRGRAILADEVGLGKTIEAGLVVSEYILRGLARRVLILCPQPLVSQWAEEMHAKFNLDFVLFDDPRFQSHSSPWATFERIIASIDAAKREPHRSQILDAFFDCVVVDEAHRCRNRGTLAWKLVNDLKKKYILLLTATPVQNDLEELYNLITLLRPGQLATVSSFRRTYISPKDRLKPRNEEELRELIREVMIRNRRSSVGITLPRRRAETIRVQLTPEEAAFYHGVSDYVREALLGTGGAGKWHLLLKTLQREAGSSFHAALPTLEKLRAEMSACPEGPRLAALIERGRQLTHFSKGLALVRLLRSLAGRKVIVFTGFRRTQEALLALLAEAGLRAVSYHGEMRRQEKEEAVRAFAEEVSVLVSTESGGEGRNLQFCHTMVNFDLPWNPMRIEQRIGRLHRIGQTREVEVYNLSAAGTIEDHLLGLLDAKINLFELVVGELDMILGNLADERDFEDLLLDLWVRSRSEAELRENLEKLGQELVRAREQYLAAKERDRIIFG